MLLINNADVQRRAQQQIDDVIGRERDVTLADRERLPYVEATVWEVQRFKTIAPLAFGHYTMKDTSVTGYDVPADTHVFLNLQQVHMNPKTWGDPEVFRPDRFVNSDGKFTKHDHFIPFSLGRRQCLGELLARQELFLFTATLLQKFNFESGDVSSKHLDEDGILGFTFCPKAFIIRATSRYNTD